MHAINNWGCSESKVASILYSVVFYPLYRVLALLSKHELKYARLIKYTDRFLKLKQGEAFRLSKQCSLINRGLFILQNRMKSNRFASEAM